MDINYFAGEYGFLSNAYNQEITVDGLTYTNAAAAFWAQRIKDPKSRRKLIHLSGVKAKAKASNCVAIDNWDSKQYAIMKKILRIKFAKNTDLYKKLKATEPAKLINVDTYRDEYWGVYRDWETDRKSTRLNSSHSAKSRMPSSA